MTMPNPVPELYMPESPYRLAMPASGEYAELSELIGQVFKRAYGAQVTVSYPQLLGVYGPDHKPRAALGLRGAGEEPLFLERYLEKPVEQVVLERTGRIIERGRIAEAGNLASMRLSALRNLMFALSVTLKQAEFDYILVTGTESLRAYLELLGLRPTVYAQAQPEKLGQDAASWGRYYDTQPKVMGGTVDDFYHGLLAAYGKGGKA